MIQANGDPASLQQGEPLDEKVPYLEFCTSANYAGKKSKVQQFFTYRLILSVCVYG